MEEEKKEIVEEEKVEAAEEVKEEKAEEAQEEKKEEGKEEKAEEKKEEKSFFEKLMDTPDTTAEFDAKDIEDNKAMAVLAYFFWLVIIPLLCAPKSKFARYHANQGIIAAIFGTIFAVVFGLLGRIPGFIGVLFSIIGWIGDIFWILLWVCGIVNSANGKAKELPVIGKFKIISVEPKEEKEEKEEKKEEAKEEKAEEKKDEE